MGLSLRYDVRAEMIKRANDLAGDEIYMKKELIIPFAGKHS